MFAKFDPLIALALARLFVCACGKREETESLVVFVNHDRVIAEQVLKTFSIETGIPVEARYTTDANGASELADWLDGDDNAPARADAIWNDDYLATADLAEAGLLHPYKGSGWMRMPPTCKDADGRFVGFSASMLVWIAIAEDSVEPTAEAIIARMAVPDLTRIAMPSPRFGPGLAMLAGLVHETGRERAAEQLLDWRARGAAFSGGDKAPRNRVVSGECDLGLTSSDAYFSALDDGKPVSMSLFMIDPPIGATVAVPTTVAIVRGTARRKWAERLVDYLASEAIERRLAESVSHRLPLGPMETSTLPDAVLRLKRGAEVSIPPNELIAARGDARGWVEAEFGE